MQHPAPPRTHYTIAAFTLHQDKSLLYRKAKSPQVLHRCLNTALRLGATVISIRRIHPLPTPRAPDETPSPPPERA